MIQKIKTILHLADKTFARKAVFWNEKVINTFKMLFYALLLFLGR